MQLQIDAQLGLLRDYTYTGSEYTVKCGLMREHWDDIFRLRARVFFEELNWVPPTKRERDSYDQFAAYVAAYEKDYLLGTLRIIGPDQPWMLQNEFSMLLPEAATKLKQNNCCEVTRLAVDKIHRASRFTDGWSIADVLYQGLFSCCMLNNYRYVYMVVSVSVLRALRLSGLPCERIAAPQRMADGVWAVAACLDWQTFMVQVSQKSPRMLNAYMDMFKQLRTDSEVSVSVHSVV
ncbi:MAG: GNAT family N-acetyltransferase [Gammaproteobacteria bacterium]|nr:GNAT family N-acetyltransferase [Gammaproteobacteria bacterium]MDH5802274.1 GNAT family N-acetyltransferase [Gammaproteobacteria bacterium]